MEKYQIEANESFFKKDGLLARNKEALDHAKKIVSDKFFKKHFKENL